MKTTREGITLTISDIAFAGSITAAIHAACKESDPLASGTIGPSFACSGPGTGWSFDYDEIDYAKRALSDEYGAAGYVDADDGRLATLDDDGDLVWSDESVVALECPGEDEALDEPEALAKMYRGIISGRCIADDLRDWKDLLKRVRAAADALDEIDADDL